MEELSDRVVITVIDGVRQELETSSSHKDIIHELVDHHRQLFTVALSSAIARIFSKNVTSTTTDHYAKSRLLLIKPLKIRLS